MKEKLTGALEQTKAFFGKLSTKARIMLGVGVVAIVGLAIVAAVILNNLPYTTLFTGITSTEIASITGYLEENGITDYKIQNNDTILVRGDQEAQLKAKLLMAGYPQSGFTYSTYTGMAGILATESDRSKAYIFDLQDRMAAVVRCLDGVKDAHITIAMGEDRRYVLDSSNVVNASASVMVEMQPGAKMTDDQAKAIRNLIAKSVQGLEIDEIAITDSNGNTYYGGDASSASDASTLKLTLEEEKNNRTRDAIMQVLGPLFGNENVRIAVNTTIDVSRRVGESTQYTSPEGVVAGQGVIGSQVYDREIVRDGEAQAGGAAGTATNAEIPTYVQDNATLNGDEQYVRDSGTVNNQYNTNKEQVEHLAGTVTDMTISISINSTTAGNINTNTLMGHVARASGIIPEMQDQKISIVAQPFYDNVVEPPDQPNGLQSLLNLPPWVLYAMAGGAALLVVLLILLIILGSRRSKKKKLAAARVSGGNRSTTYVEEPAEMHADIMNIRTERSMELRKDIRQFADDNPEIAAQLVKSWMRGGEEGG